MQLGEFMRKIVVVALLMAMAPVAMAEVTWNGGVGVRHLIVKQDDGLDAKNNTFENKDISKSTNKRWEFRGSLGMLAKFENVDAGIDLRTNNSQTSEWLRANNAGDLAITLGQAFGRLKLKPFESDLAVTMGRAKTVLLYDNMAQMLFDNDTRWDGFGWSWKMDMFGFNATQYVLGATSQGGASPAASTYTYTESSQETGDTKSHFGVLYAFQPHVTFKLTEEITSTFAVSHLIWSNTGATATSGWYSNNVHGGTANSTAGTAVGNTNAVSLDNSRQWHFLSDTALPFKLRFVAEYVLNKKVMYGLRNQTATGVTTAKETDHDALALSLGWGKPKKAGEFGLAYSYSNKGIGSVIGTFTNGDVLPDNQSHMFEGRYMVADSFSLGAKAQWHKEKARLGGDGQPLASPNDKREQKGQRYEIVGSVSL